MGTDSAPPYYAITADNHAAWVVAASIIFLLYSIGAVATKITLKINLTTIKVPDICLIGCLVCSNHYECARPLAHAHQVVLLVQTAFIIRACNQGLGRHSAVLDSSSYEESSKVSPHSLDL